MLFDLRGRGRRRTVQAVYLFLAILIGGGLIFFGVGTGSGGGGLFNAVNQNGSANGVNNFQTQIKTAERQVASNPKNAAAYLALTRATYQLATGTEFDQNTHTYSTKGKALIAQAQNAWNQYLKLQSKSPDVPTATEMAQALLLSNQYTDAAHAQEIVTLANPDQSNDWKLLAAYSYIAGQNDKGDLAAAKAVALAPKAQQDTLKNQLATYKKLGPSILSQSGASGGSAQLPTG